MTFVAVSDDASKVDETNQHLDPFLKLLGIKKDTFQSALCEFEIEAGKMSYTRHVKKELAEKGLEALIKAAYGAMFSVIVQSINKKIDYKPTRGAADKAAFNGVLDIFGFESFSVNSLEQLCINYANEALQQQFNKFVFKSEQEVYQREGTSVVQYSLIAMMTFSNKSHCSLGIPWDFVKFPDNADVIELIDQKTTGILSILSDQCRTPASTDSTFVKTMYNTCESHTRFEASNLQRGHQQFAVKHYAGLVVYDTEGFLEKNKDEIPRGASELLQSSTKEFVQMIGKIIGTKKRRTVGSQFKVQLDELRERITNTSPHYIRCLKPNILLQADDFDREIVADQLRYAGVLEAIRVSRLGYSQRYPYNVFMARYGIIEKEHASTVDELVTTIAKILWKRENPHGEL